MAVRRMSACTSPAAIAAIAGVRELVVAVGRCLGVNVGRGPEVNMGSGLFGVEVVVWTAISQSTRSVSPLSDASAFCVEMSASV